MSHQYTSYAPPDPATLHHHDQSAITPQIIPRPLSALQKPPTPSSPLPELPSPVRNPSFTASYTLTTHLYPSAYPRTPSKPLPRSSYSDVPEETKLERHARQEALVHALWVRSRSAVGGGGEGEGGGGGGGEGNRDMLWNAVNRYVRNDLLVGEKREARGLTLFFAHANGFHKEIWEPFLQETFSQAEAANVLIDEVWAFESVQHGDSGLINDNIIGDTFDWADNTRDILTFLIYHLPPSPFPFPGFSESTALPTHLPRLPDGIAAQRLRAGYADRILVGVGHSLGGCSITRAALAHPALFASLILVDPVIRPRWVFPPVETGPPSLATVAIRRQTKWSSRKDALLRLQSSSFFGVWHPAVLGNYVKYGMCPDPNPPNASKTREDEDAHEDGDIAVQLKLSGVQEAVVFIDVLVSYETWELLPHLDPRIALYFILSGKDASALGGEQAARELAWRRPANTSNIIVPFSGHLIPQEAPQALATLVVGFLKERFSRQRSEGTKTQPKAML